MSRKTTKIVVPIADAVCRYSSRKATRKRFTRPARAVEEPSVGSVSALAAILPACDNVSADLGIGSFAVQGT
jgi:hypothetical protein